MDLIFFYIISTLYRKPATKEEYNTILFLLLLSLCNNNMPKNRNNNNSSTKKTNISRKKHIDNDICVNTSTESFDNLNNDTSSDCDNDSNSHLDDDYYPNKDNDFNDDYFKDYDFNDISISQDQEIVITNNFEHILNSTNHNNSQLSPCYNYNFNLSEDSNRTFRLPTLLFRGSISDSFKGDINFHDYIASINEVKNKLIITSNLLLLDIDSREKATLFIDGYLETDIDYSIPSNYQLPLVCKHSNYVIRIPFHISTGVNLQYIIPDERNSFSDLDLHLTKTSFTIKEEPLENKLLEDDVSLFRKSKFIIIANYNVDIFKNELFKY